MGMAHCSASSPSSLTASWLNPCGREPAGGAGQGAGAGVAAARALCMTKELGCIPAPAGPPAGCSGAPAPRAPTFSWVRPSWGSWYSRGLSSVHLGLRAYSSPAARAGAALGRAVPRTPAGVAEAHGRALALAWPSRARARLPHLTPAPPHLTCRAPEIQRVCRLRHVGCLHAAQRATALSQQSSSSSGGGTHWQCGNACIAPRPPRQAGSRLWAGRARSAPRAPAPSLCNCRRCWRASGASRRPCAASRSPALRWGRGAVVAAARSRLAVAPALAGAALATHAPRRSPAPCPRGSPKQRTCHARGSKSP